MSDRERTGALPRGTVSVLITTNAERAEICRSERGTEQLPRWEKYKGQRVIVQLPPITEPLWKVTCRSRFFWRIISGIPTSGNSWICEHLAEVD